MRLLPSALAVVVLCATATSPSRAADASRTAAMRENVQRALQSEETTLVFWQPLNDGTVREKRSGLICPGELSPEMPLEFLSGPVPASSSSVVGCVHRSADRSHVVHVILSPNLLGAEETRKMMRMAYEYTEKDFKSLGATPIPGVPEGEEEGFTTVADGKARLHYVASAPVGRWFVMVHTFAPRVEPIDLKQVRGVPVSILVAAIADIGGNRNGASD